MGFFSWVEDAVRDVGSSIDDGVRQVGSSVDDGVREVGSSIDDAIIEPIGDALANLDDFVNETVPGGWAGVILIASGVYYAPEIGAYFSSTGAPLTAAEASTAISAEAAAAEAAATTAGSTGTGLTAGGSGVGLTGGNTANLAAMGGGQGLTGASTAGTTVGATGGTLAYGGLGSNIGLSSAVAAATPAQMAAANARGMSVLDYARAGLLVNSLTGDPLGLAGEQPSGGGLSSSGFGIVPIPSDWQRPTYAAPSAPIDLNSIFSNQDMLGGTQWQDMPQQQNISFNDIFAAGQQQTPMGTPVDINQIVSSILGQTATSQKPA